MKGHTVLKIFIAVVAVVFVFHQLYSSLYRPITTETALYSEAVDGLKITGTIIRRESIITNTVQGVFHFVTVDGSRVAKGGTVAEIYDSADASITLNRIETIKKQIADLEELQGYNDLQASDLELADGRVTSALGGLVFENSGGNFFRAPDNLSALLSAINRRQMITGEHTDFSPQLAALNAELTTLSGKLTSAKGYITAAESGYFVSVTDGYENVFTVDSLGSITPEFLNDSKPATTPENAIGKIVSDYEWYIAARVSINDSLKYKEGDSLTIRTDVMSNPTLPVEVAKINISESSDSAVVIFSCRQMSSELATMRTGAMTVVSRTYKGLRFPRKALRVVDGKTGVYTVSGIVLKFVPVKVIYSQEDYVICEQEQSNSTVLRLYDEVVVKGRKLYEGKIVG